MKIFLIAFSLTFTIPAYADENTKLFQLMLNQLRYSPGAIDGAWGPQTEKAAKEFWNDYTFAQKLNKSSLPDTNPSSAIVSIYKACSASFEVLKEVEEFKSEDFYKDLCNSFAIGRLRRNIGENYSEILLEEADPIIDSLARCAIDISAQTVLDIFMSTARNSRIPYLEFHWQFFASSYGIEKIIEMRFSDGTMCQILQATAKSENSSTVVIFAFSQAHEAATAILNSIN